MERRTMMILDPFCRAKKCEHFYTYPFDNEIKDFVKTKFVTGLACSSCKLMEKTVGISKIPDACPYNEEMKAYYVRRKLKDGEVAEQEVSPIIFDTKEFQNIIKLFEESMKQVAKIMIIPVPDEHTRSKSDTE